MPQNTNYELISNIISDSLPTVSPVEVGTPTDNAHAVTKLYADALNPMTAEGDIILGGASGALSALAIGAVGKILKSNGTTLTYEDESGGGGGSAMLWKLWENGNAAFEEMVSEIELLSFDKESNQGVVAILAVPSTYTAGVQILLKGGVFAANSQVGNVKFKATTYLIQPGSTILGTYSDSHASTNAEVDMSGSGAANEITSIGDIDLTDGSGEINSVAVAASDMLLIVLQRDNDNESSSCVEDAKLLRYSFEPSFS